MAEPRNGRDHCCAACASRCTNGYDKSITTVQRKIGEWTGALGAHVARRPILFVVVSILIAAAASGGWARFRIESATDKLWVPQDSEPMKNGDWVKDNYASGGGSAQVLGSVLPSRQYGNNALQLQVFWELFQVDAAVRAINVTSGGRIYTWKDVCETDFDGNCKYTGPLNLWSMNLTNYLAAVNGSATDPNAGNRDALIQDVNQQRFPDGTAISTLSLFGGIVLSQLPNPPEGRPPFYMSAAEVILLPYNLRDGLGDVENKWYNSFLDVLKDKHSRTQYTALAYIAGSSVSDEIGRSVTNDLYLIVISVAIFVLVAVIGLSRWHLVGTRSSLALLGVVSAVLAMVAAYGLSLLFNCPFNTLSQTLPYVLLGLSVDCMFILVKAYDGLVAAGPPAGGGGSGGVSLQSRFRALLSGGGASVVVTLLASAVAFALGAISELPAVVWFSVYATMGVLCILVASLTFFTGVFVLTERRIAANRLDCCCCATSGGPQLPNAATAYYDTHEPSAAADPSSTSDAGGKLPRPPLPPSSSVGGRQGVLKAVVITPGAAAAPAWQDPPARRPVAESAERGGGGDGGPQQVAALDGVYVPQPAAATEVWGPQNPSSTPSPGSFSPEPNLMKLLFARYYAPFLTKWWAKVLVLAAFCGWAVLSGVGIPRLGEGQPLSELAPDDSYLQDYVTITSNTFSQQVGSPASLYFRGVDPASPQQQAAMLTALSLTLTNPFVNSTVSAFQGNWLIDFIGWVQSARPNVTLVSLPGCVNPFPGRVSGDLGQFVRPPALSGCVPQEQFYPLLDQFLESHRGYLNDLQWSFSAGPDGAAVRGGLWSSRLPIVHTAPGDDGAYGRELLKSVQHLQDSVNEGVFAAANAAAAEPVFFLYNGNYIYYAGDAILGSMTLEYVLLAVAGVGLVLLATLPSLRAVVLMMVSVGLVDYFLFGQMFILGIRFNQVSIINMIMATGLSVDYSVYFAQRFVAVTADGSRNGRMVAAMADTGSAVFVGGLTALTGTIPLAFASSHILRVFFALIFGTICFALLVGLMLMPVVFSLVGPPPPRHRDKTQQQQQQQGEGDGGQLAAV